MPMRQTPFVKLHTMEVPRFKKTLTRKRPPAKKTSVSITSPTAYNSPPHTHSPRRI